MTAEGKLAANRGSVMVAPLQMRSPCRVTNIPWVGVQDKTGHVTCGVTLKPYRGTEVVQVSTSRSVHLKERVVRIQGYG